MAIVSDGKLLKNAVDKFLKESTTGDFWESSTVLIGDFKKGNCDYQIHLTVTRDEDSFMEFPDDYKNVLDCEV